MKQSVYIETSVISYLTSRLNENLIVSGRQRSTRIAWPKITKQFKCFISILVYEEAKQGDRMASAKRLEAINNMPLLEVTPECQQLAQNLIEKKLFLNSTLKTHFILV